MRGRVCESGCVREKERVCVRERENVGVLVGVAPKRGVLFLAGCVCECVLVREKECVLELVIYWLSLGAKVPCASIERAVRNALALVAWFKVSIRRSCHAVSCGHRANRRSNEHKLESYQGQRGPKVLELCGSGSYSLKCIVLDQKRPEVVFTKTHFAVKYTRSSNGPSVGFQN